jgi:hypothetical protein
VVLEPSIFALELDWKKLTAGATAMFEGKNLKWYSYA